MTRQRDTIDGRFVRSHGMARTPEYAAWRGMKSRCLNPNRPNYADYGGRGIAVCDRWLESFENFLADMGPRPAGMSLDRIDVNGNYEPGNCRWLDATTQQYNKRKLSGTTSRFVGVSLDGGRWVARAPSIPGGPRPGLGRYSTEEEAARARDAYVIEHGIDAPLNFPEAA